MDLSSYMFAFLGMAVVTIAILTISTLAAAELLPRLRRRSDDRVAPAGDSSRTPAGDAALETSGR